MNPKEYIVLIVGIAIIAVIIFVMVREAKKIRWDYKVHPQKKVSKRAVQAMLGLFWAATIYHLKFNWELGYEIAIPLVTAIALVAYYIMKRGIIEE